MSGISYSFIQKFFTSLLFYTLLFPSLNACTQHQQYTLPPEPPPTYKTDAPPQKKEPFLYSEKRPKEKEEKEKEKKEKQYPHPYRLHGGDLLLVNIYGEEELSREYRLSETGSIHLPLVGKLNLKDLTLSEAQDLIKKAYKNGYLINPDILLELKEHL